MKAWVCRAADGIEGFSFVKFADTANKARYAALNDLRSHGEADEYAEVEDGEVTA